MARRCISANAIHFGGVQLRRCAEAVRRSTSDVFSGSWALWLPGPGLCAAAELLKQRGLGEHSYR